MGLPCIYYYPNESHGFRKVSFAHPFATVQESFDRVVEGIEQGDLTIQRTDYGGRTRIRILRDGITDRDFVMALRTMITHLQKGLPISVAADRAKTFASYTEDPYLPSGTTTINTEGNQYSHYESVTAPAAGDYLVIRGPNPEGLHEEVKVSSWAGSTKSAVVTPQTAYEFERGPIFIRSELFWPVMYLPDELVNSDQILTEDRRYLWNLDLTLIESPNIYANLWQNSTGDTEIIFSNEESTVETLESGGYTLQGAVKAGETTTYEGPSIDGSSDYMMSWDG